jgi:DNA modification methylase
MENKPHALPILPLEIPRFSDPQDILPMYAEEPLFLLGPTDVFASLRKMDWSFVDDNTGFLAHDIHPYPAKFIPQIPGTLISQLSTRGELVFDPFGGSGTTALEAVRLGRRALSLDANPLAALIGRAKTACIDRATARELHGMHAALAAELQALPHNPERLITLHQRHAPDIPNRGRWFADSAFGELCLIKARIAELETQVARDVALVALSRIAIRASFQDSETRYKSVPREVPVGETLRRYLKEFRSVIDAIAQSEAATRYGISDFATGDIRNLGTEMVPDGSVDLIVTSPPYGNATDYHLYHRFRLLWLGFDPVGLSHVEIGSHLKHQREKSGFESYFADLRKAVATTARVLRPSRYAALVLGESIYEGVRHDPAARLVEAAEELGFDACSVFDRPVHATKRSFAQAGRRLTSERILIMRRRANGTRLKLGPPPYRLWPYERILRLREAGVAVRGKKAQDPEGPLTVVAGLAELGSFRRLAFSHSIAGDGLSPEPTWQAAIENGGAVNPAARKDPKYATHGLHPYKGKFYPQLAKGLLNLVRKGDGAILLDPFCGSGTTLLEGYLNGFAPYGCDMHPLAAKIARAKTEILDTDPDVLTEVVATVQDAIASPPGVFPADASEFPKDCLEEIERWFPAPVLARMNWLLKTIRKMSAGPVRDFLEVILSSIVRDVSQQDPSDLRIRYRKKLLQDANVLELFREQLIVQFARVEKFWRVRGRAPSRFRRAHVMEGDNRDPATFERLGLEPESVDLVLTSPPYATALPYIDTDRLSLLAILGLSSPKRRPLESGLTGSREISPVERRRVDDLSPNAAGIPPACRTFLAEMRTRLAKDTDAGFRKQNMPALMTRYLLDMNAALRNVYALCRPGAEAMIVIGDNRTMLGGRSLRIPTTDLVEEVSIAAGFERVERIDISVTTENMLHQKHAITENVVLRLLKR